MVECSMEVATGLAIEVIKRLVQTITEKLTFSVVKELFPSPPSNVMS